METSKSSPFSSFKSKKLLRNEEGKTSMTSPEDGKTPMTSPAKVSEPASTPLRVQTPCKAANPLRRLRHRSAAMSIKEVRQAALMLRERGSPHTSGNDPELETEKEKERVPRPKKMSADSETTLPEKYELLDKFFNSLDSSIRLLQLKRSATIFTNISSQIERLTDRRFTHSHLAQLKFIMPEVIVVETVLRHDERTSCMKPDLRITLNVEAIDKSKSKSSGSNLQLRKMFRDRLLDFFKSHPKGDEVPGEALPEPFSQLKNDPDPVPSSVPSLMNETPDVGTSGQTVIASHLPVSFKGRISKRQSINLENVEQEKASNSFGSESQHFEITSSGKETGGIAVNSYSGSMPTSLPGTPIKCINSREEDSNQNFIETADGCCVSTPGLRPPKRCYMSPDDDSSRLSNKLARRAPKRPLTFGSPVKSVNTVDGKFCRSNISSTDDDIYDILPVDLIQSIQEKERLAKMEKDPAISQAKWRKKMLASLPKLFDMVFFLFQSIRRSVITKEELIQKIITGHLDIVDRKEIEDQLRLLLEFAPEWISEKAGLSGDNLICVSKISCPEAIRRRLLEAK